MAVILTSGSLASFQQLSMIIAGLERANNELEGFDIIPVSTPSFGFPTATFYNQELPKMFEGEEEIALASEAMRDFFNRISVAFSIHASDGILETQAWEVFCRIPKAGVETYNPYSLICV